MNQKELLTQNPMVVFYDIDSKISIEPTFYQDNACITQQHAIIDAIEENEDKIPKNCEIFTCGHDSTHTPHHWVQIDFLEGNKIKSFIWDRTDDYFTGTHFMPLEEAKNKYQYYGEPSYKMQFHPDIEE